MATLKKLAAALCVLALSGCHAPAEWFLTPNQQGRLWLERGEPLQAARRFEDRLWKGLAYYEAGEFASASSALATLDTALAKFQYGNSLARQERLPEAIAAYERALSLDPDLREASFNLDWVRSLVELDQREYEDAGGTGGKLEADKIVFDDEGARGEGEMTVDEARAQGLDEAELRELWMRRVQTTPADFLRLKFSFQDQMESGS